MLPPVARLALKNNKNKRLIYTPDVSDDITKVDANNFAKNLNWENHYVQSPKFKERVEKAGYNYMFYKMNQKRKLRTMSLRADDDEKSNTTGAYYRTGINDVSINSKKLNTNYYGQEFPTDEDVLRHEIGHSFNNEKLEDFINARNIYQPKTEKDKKELEEKIKKAGGASAYYNTHEGHEKEYGEVVADVHSARREIYDYGIKTRGKTKAYDGRYSNFTDQAYEDMKKVAEGEGRSASKRLLEKIQRKATDQELRTIPNPAKVETEEQQKVYEQKFDNIQNKLNKDKKQYIFDVMNRVVNNTTPINNKNVFYGANGGLIERPSSRKRAIVPLIIGAALAVGSAVASSSANAKARREQRRQLGKQQLEGLSNQYAEQAIGDTAVANEFNPYGDEQVQYYAEGGKMGNFPQNISPEQISMAQNRMTQTGGIMPNLPVSAGGFQTQGGNLVPIGDGIEEARGNRHNETTIDGVSGIQLHKDGEVQAEIEDKEIVADGNVVYSDRLLFDKNNSYADKMRKLVKKRNQIEKRQEETTDWRVKNTAERQLAGLNMAEYSLYQHQEQQKYNEGIEVANKLAYGGKIRKLAYGGNSESPLPVYNWMRPFYMRQNKGKYSGYNMNALNQYQDSKDSRIKINNDGTPMYEYEPSNVVSPMNRTRPRFTTTPTATVQPDNTVGNILGAASSVVGSLGSNTGGVNAPASAEVSNTVANANATNKINWGSVASNIGKYAPLLIDNVGNYLATRNTPELPTPLLNRAENLETRVNIQPQLAEARRRRRTINNAILNNTSSSNNAKNNIVASSLAGERTVDELLAQKQNQELTLRNASAQNRQLVAGQNNAIMNEYGFRQFQRSNDIQTRNSANLANLQGDIKTVLTGLQLDNQFKTNTMANLADDSLGEKAIVYAQNKEFMSDGANRDYIFNKALETNADGTPKNPQLVELLKRLYNWGN